MKHTDQLRRGKKIRFFLMMMVFTVLALGMTASAGFRKVRVPGTSQYRYRYYISKYEYLAGSKNRTPRYKQWTYKNLKSGRNTYTYCFDKNGYMLTGWQSIVAKDGKVYKYYFDANGRMFKNRTKNGHYLQHNGRMLTDGWYNGVYYGKDGAAVTGYKAEGKFVKTKKGTKYMQPDGTYAAKTWKCIKDKDGKYYWYYFYSSGYMAKNKWLGNRHVNKLGRWDRSK